MNKELQKKCQRKFYHLMLCTAYLGVAAVPIAIGIVRPGITGYERAMVEDLVYGRAYRPFVNRQLVPLIVRGSSQLIPDKARIWLQDKFLGSKLANQLGWTPRYAPEIFLVLIVMYASLVGFLFVLRRFLLCFLDLPPGLDHLTVLAVCVGLPVTFAGQMYVYDFTQLLLFTATLILLFKQRWCWLYPMYTLVCINKETGMLIPVVLLVWLGAKALRPPYLWHLLGQILIGLSIYLVIGYVFRNNPGGSFEWHLHRNITMSVTILGKFRLVVLVVAVIISLWKFPHAPVFLRRGLIATLPVLLCATFFFGYLDELRDYYEALPFVIGLTLLAMGSKMKVDRNLMSGP